MNIKEIKKGVFYVGVNDRTTHRFEALWPLPYGVSYNSYIVTGEKTALIDGVEISQCDNLVKRVKEIIGDKQPDYLVINHMEPDHSGAIKVLRGYFPDMTIVGNAKTLEMVNGFYGITDNVMAVKDGDTLALGGKTLSFRLIPMVHWPETMVTYVAEDKVLFSGDAFGCFGALNGAVIDEEMDIEPYIPEMYRYYSNIVGKYGAPVQKALAKTADLEIEYICSTHGPVWHKNLGKVVSIYDKLSKYEAEDGVVIVYGSMYGNTQEMAEAIATRLAERGVKKIKMHNATYSHLSYILSDIFQYKGLIIGAPTYSNTLFPPIETLLQAIKTRELKNRIVGAFGSFTWASKSVKRINEVLEECHLFDAEIVSVENKQAPGKDAIEKCRALADAIVDKM